ncbi:MAG: 50S ribosomal protein L19 [Solitalea-like symbiont of Acarus siro]
MEGIIQLVSGTDMSQKAFPGFQSGDTIAVHYKIKEGNKERIQIFQGVVIRRRGSDMGQTFTVRKISNNVGVERIFPLYSHNIDKIELVSLGKVRRAKLYYIRNQAGKIRIKKKIINKTLKKNPVS